MSFSSFRRILSQLFRRKTLTKLAFAGVNTFFESHAGKFREFGADLMSLGAVMGRIMMNHGVSLSIAYPACIYGTGLVLYSAGVFYVIRGYTGIIMKLICWKR